MAQATSLPAFNALTFENASVALTQGYAAIKAGQTVFELGSVQQADSSGVAVLLAWKRQAARAGLSLSLRNLPAGLHSLAVLYGVDAFLVDPLAATPANLQHH